MQQVINFLLIVSAGLILMILCGCSTTIPSQSISNASQNELKAISSEIKDIQGRVVAECPSIVENLRTLSVRIDNVSGQVGNISLACQTEKRVLEETITVRNLIILISLIINLILAYVFLRKIVW